MTNQNEFAKLYATYQHKADELLVLMADKQITRDEYQQRINEAMKDYHAAIAKIVRMDDKS